VSILKNMTAPPLDPIATQHDGTPDPEHQGPEDPQTLRLREENRALRELLAAQVQASLPRHAPGWIERVCWRLISAPGTALAGWRSLSGREEGKPITRRRVGRATMTVLYTFAIYGALVLLVVSWNSPNTATSGATAASPVRVPLAPLPTLPPKADTVDNGAASTLGGAPAGTLSESAPSSTSIPEALAPSAASERPAPPSASSAAPATASPQPMLRITEIPASDPMAWVAMLDGELARCADLGFFERPECAWTARKQYCEPNRGWGHVKECPALP